MSNSDKEFEEWYSEMMDSPIIRNSQGLSRLTWNHLYPYKERCEELEAALFKYDAAAEEFIKKSYRKDNMKLLEFMRSKWAHLLKKGER